MSDAIPPAAVAVDGAEPGSPDRAAPTTVREIPSALVALIILLCLAGAAWFVWTNWFRSGPAERIVFLDRGPDDGVKQITPGRFDVRSGNAALTITKSGDAGADVAFRWAKQEYLTPEQIKLLTIVLRLTRDPAMANELQLSPQQLERLKANRARAKVELPEADAARLRSLFLAYDAEKDPAAKRKAETKLVKALDAVAAQLEGPAKQVAADRTADAKAILSPEQIGRFDKVGQEPPPGVEPAATPGAPAASLPLSPVRRGKVV